MGKQSILLQAISLHDIWALQQALTWRSISSSLLLRMKYLVTTSWSYNSLSKAGDLLRNCVHTLRGAQLLALHAFLGRNDNSICINSDSGIIENAVGPQHDICLAALSKPKNQIHVYLVLVMIERMCSITPDRQCDHLPSWKEQPLELVDLTHPLRELIEEQ